MKKINKHTKKILISLLLFVLFINIFSNFTFSKETDIGSDKKLVFPEQFSWQNINGIDYTTPIKNQELCKSDAAFALIASLETILQYRMGFPFYCDLSEASLFYNCNGSFENGVNIISCADYLVEYGVPDEGCFPYPEKSYDPSLYFNQPGRENRSIKIQGWSWVENNVSDIKKALIQNGPVVVQINYTFNFLNYKKGIYNPRGNTLGNQWICIVGYNDERGVWICKNSWGVRWGEYGFVKIPYKNNVFNSDVSSFKDSTGVLSINCTIDKMDQKIPIVKIFQPSRGLKYTGKSRTERLFVRSSLINERSQYVIFNKLLNSIFKRRNVDIRTPIVKKECYIEVYAVRYSGNYSIYIDDELMFVFNGTTFFQEVKFDKPGIHFLKVEATNEKGVKSVDIREFYVL